MTVLLKDNLPISRGVAIVLQQLAERDRLKKRVEYARQKYLRRIRWRRRSA